MATRVFDAGKVDMLKVNAETADLRVALLMSNSTAGTVADTGISFVSNLTLDEFGGSGYARQVLANKSVNKDDANNRGELDADDVNFGVLGAGLRPVIDVLVYRHVTTDADSIPWSVHTFATAKTMDGSEFIAKIDVDGLIQLT